MSYTPIPGLSKDDLFNNILKEKELIKNKEKIEEEISMKRDIIKKYLNVINIDYITNAIIEAKVKIKNENYNIILIKEEMYKSITVKNYTSVNGKYLLDKFGNYYNINRTLLLNEPLKNFKIDNLSEYDLTNEDENKSFLEIINSKLPSHQYKIIIKEYNHTNNHDIELECYINPFDTKDIIFCNFC